MFLFKTYQLMRLQRQAPLGVLLNIGYAGRHNVGIALRIAHIARLQIIIFGLNAIGDNMAGIAIKNTFQFVAM